MTHFHTVHSRSLHRLSQMAALMWSQQERADVRRPPFSRRVIKQTETTALAGSKGFAGATGRSSGDRSKCPNLVDSTDAGWMCTGAGCADIGQMMYIQHGEPRWSRKAGVRGPSCYTYLYMPKKERKAVPPPSGSCAVIKAPVSRGS